jgi:asparagine synthase (glutamine-hydrolysing)
MQGIFGRFNKSVETAGADNLPESFLSDQVGNSPCGKVTLILDGKIFNSQSLSKKLAEESVSLTSESEADVMATALAQWKEAALEQFSGKFALAAHFHDDNTLLLARDQTGIKNIFYEKRGDEFLFSSELSTLKKLWETAPAINLPAMHHYLSFGHSAASIHLLEGVNNLAPGHCLWSGGSTYRYSKAGFHNLKLDNDETESLRELLRQSVREQSEGDKRHGIILNGKSSTAILAALAGHEGRKLQAFHFNFDFMDDEFQNKSAAHAEIIANSCDLSVKQIKVTEDEINQSFEQRCKEMESPHGVGAYHALYCAFDKIKDEVDVLLSANGGNIVFAGHAQYALVKTKSAASTKTGFLKSMASLFETESSRWEKLKEYEKIIEPYLINDKQGVRRLLLDDYNGRWHEHSVGPLMINDPQNEFPLSVKMQWFELQDHLAAHSNSMLNKISEDAGIEINYPFQNPELIKRVLQLKENERLQGQTPHPLLNKLISGLLPPEILKCPTLPSEFPYDLFLKNGLKELVTTYLSENEMQEMGLFNITRINNMVERELNGEKDQGVALWAILVFAIWYSQIKAN